MKLFSIHSCIFKLFDCQKHFKPLDTYNIVSNAKHACIRARFEICHSCYILAISVLDTRTARRPTPKITYNFIVMDMSENRLYYIIIIYLNSIFFFFLNLPRVVSVSTLKKIANRNKNDIFSEYYLSYVYYIIRLGVTNR